MPAWKLDYSGNPIPIEQAISTMTFSDEAPATGNGSGFFTNCRGGATVRGGRFPGHVADLPASARVHAALPVLGQPDLRRAAVEALLHDQRSQRLGVGDDQPQGQPGRSDAGDPALRSARAAHREGADAVAAARRLLHDARVPGAVEHQRQQPAPRDGQPDAAGGAGAVVHQRLGHHALSTEGLDSTHAVDGTECVGCHKSLDPMRQFWGNQLDFNDRNDFPMGNRFTGAAANPRPAAPGGGFAFGDVNETGPDITAVGTMLARVTDGGGLHRFSIAIARISASGPTRRRAARATPSSAAWSARSRTAAPTTTSPC